MWILLDFGISLTVNSNHLTLLKILTPMIVTCVYVHVKPDKVSMFVEATSSNHFESVKEQGNLRFDLVQQADDPTKFMIYEAYENEAAAANHKKTDHYLKWRDLVNDYMAEPRYSVKYNIIEPNDRTKW
jgi:(4S)-4-hydroxy-5-phosphonooxypentane-2,3-dione isomerase